MSDWYDQKTRQTRRPRRLEEIKTAEVGLPIAWILIGSLSGLIVIGLVGLGVVNMIRKQSAVTPTPTNVPGLVPTQLITESAPSQQAATPTIPPVVTLEPTTTSPPTETPPPTVPPALEVGVYAKIVGTEGAGVSMRAGPGTNNARLNVAPEEGIVLILDGPRADENLQEFVWWFIRDADGNEGWAVQDYLEPSLPPDLEQTDN
jgi:hypothetical protein